MKNETITIWNKPLENALDHLVEHIHPAEAAANIKGCAQIADFITNMQPDVVLIPERGAAPIWWSAATVLNEQEIFIPSFELPIGTSFSVDSVNFSGLTKPDKKTLVKMAINLIVPKLPNNPKILVIDEVQSGGSLMQAVKAIKTALSEIGINDLWVLGVEDTRHDLYMRPKKNGYYTMMQNNRHGLHGAKIRIPLSCMDRQPLLNRIIFITDVRSRFHYPHLWQNTDGQAIISLLTIASMYPFDFASAITEIAGERRITSPQIPQSRERVDKFKITIKKIVDMASPGARQSVMSWLEEYIQVIVNFSSADCT